MADKLFLEMNCENSPSSDPKAFNNQLKYSSSICPDVNGGLKRAICDEVLPNNNVFVSETLPQCYSSDMECSNNLNKICAPVEIKPDFNLPVCSSNLNFNSVNLHETDTYSESSQDSHNYLTNTLIESQPSEEGLLTQNIFKTEEDRLNVDFNNGVDLNKTNNKISKSNKRKVSMGANRGRPRKALVTTYHSQISGDKNTIKIRIKKSNLIAQFAPNKKKSGRRKKQKAPSDTDVSDYESCSKRVKYVSNNAMEATEAANVEPLEQSVWGEHLPHKVLYRIFQYTSQDGSLPILVRLCKVCRLWREVAMSPCLWRKVDLNWVKERYRTDIQLHWLIQNRLMYCQDLNLGEWKIRDIQVALEALLEHCPELKGLNLSGWKGLNADNLKYISSECNKLERLDLSSINSTSAINAQPLVNLAQSMKSRLTHLILAHNKIAGFTQIINSIADNCANLQLLDISNIKTFAHNSALLRIEKLQIGCPKLRVLRITNSQIYLAQASLTDQVASPGFPKLEELSLAGFEEDKTTTARSVCDDDIERILKTSKKLRLLDIRSCIRLTDSGLVRVPAWDLEHLFLSACCITRAQNSGLELILQKWSHSLVEVDLAWSTATSSLDAAVLALAEKGSESPLRILNLCGSSVSLEPVKAVLMKCPNLHSINLQSCRALPRGIKRFYTGSAVAELRESLQDKPKIEEKDLEASCGAQSTSPQ